MAQTSTWDSGNVGALTETINLKGHFKKKGAVETEGRRRINTDCCPQPPSKGSQGLFALPLVQCLFYSSIDTKHLYCVLKIFPMEETVVKKEILSGEGSCVCTFLDGSAREPSVTISHRSRRP